MNVPGSLLMNESPEMYSFSLNKYDGDLFEKEGLDPILVESNRRFVMFPINYNQIWGSYKQAESLFWTAEDFDFSKDINNYKEIDDKTKNIVVLILYYMSIQHNIEIYPVEGYLCDEIQSPEARCIFGYFMMQKNIHMELYSNIYSKIKGITSDNVIRKSYSDYQKFEYLSMRKNYINAYISNNETHFVIKMVALSAFVCIASQSIFLLMLLIATNNLENVNTGLIEDNPEVIMPNLLEAQGRINSDYSVFSDFLATVFNNNMNTRPKSHVALQIVKDSVTLEETLFKDILATSNFGPNVIDSIVIALRESANFVCTNLGYEKLYKDVPCPCPLTENIILKYIPHYHTKRFHLEKKKDSSSILPKNHANPGPFTIDEEF